MDDLYRQAMKSHERGELLECTRRVAETLQITASDVPIEGYYAESEQLTEYFRLMRTLQETPEAAMPRVESLPEFKRLRDVASSPIYGPVQDVEKLLPRGCDALSQALLQEIPDWTVAGLTAAAARIARETDDISLVGLAARIEDSVLLAATRESVILYGMAILGLEDPNAPRIEYIWKVHEDLARQGKTFVQSFNALFGNELPLPCPEEAHRYWHAHDDNQILGRCARLGSDDSTYPIQHYHWAIYLDAAHKFAVQEFWSPDVWTTERYKFAMSPDGGCPDLQLKAGR
jgi:hypothetical protein